MATPDASLSLRYRADIDGLRAVAVLLVLAFHAGLPGVPGGYVGVDVFFVISGFLITSILLREIEQGHFSFTGFYARRARRILPALAFVLLGTAIASTWLLLPTALAAFGRSVAATALSASNVLFWLDGGYFATSSELKPLLHTWSLSLEEQFYLVHPAFLLLVHRLLPKRRTSAIAALLALSFGVSVVATGRFDFAYYLLPSRAWELMCGALLAAIPNARLASQSLRNALGVLGMGSIAVASVAFSNATVFPGFAALLPCVGAMLVLLSGAGGQHLLGRLLETRPFVYVGKRSYSLYLWHWPLLVLPKYYLVRPLTNGEALLALATALGAAEVSYRFIESPFRRSGTQTNFRTLAFAGATLSILAVAGATLTFRDGFPERVSTEVLALERTQVEVDIPDPSCFGGGALADVPHRPGCFLGSPKQTASFVLWGDSHGSAVSLALGREAQAAGRAGLLLTHNGCPPLVGATIYTGARPYADCQRFEAEVLRGLEHAPEVEDVVLVSRWSVYIHGYLPSESAGDLGPAPLLWDGTTEVNTDEDRALLLERALGETARRLRKADKRVFVTDPIPEIGQHVPTTLARRARFQDPSPLELSAATYEERNSLVLSVFERLERQGLIVRLAPERTLCDAQICRVQAGNVALYADDDHLSHAGALYVAPVFASTFD